MKMKVEQAQEQMYQLRERMDSNQDTQRGLRMMEEEIVLQMRSLLRQHPCLRLRRPLDRKKLQNPPAEPEVIVGKTFIFVGLPQVPQEIIDYLKSTQDEAEKASGLMKENPDVEPD